MNNMNTMRMLLSTAALAAFAALFAAGANAMVQDDGGAAGGAPAVTTVKPSTIPYLSHGIGVDETQSATPTSPGFTGVHAALANRAAAPAAVDNTLDPAIRKAIENRAFGSGLIGDRPIRKAIEHRAFGSGLIGDPALTRSSAPQFRGAHRGLRPGRSRCRPRRLPARASIGRGSGSGQA